MKSNKQGYSARADESLGMRRGPERNKSQSYKSRRDESYGMKSYGSKHNSQYMSKGSSKGKIMGHDKSPTKVYVPEGQGFREVKNLKPGMKGYPHQAFDYKY